MTNDAEVQWIDVAADETWTHFSAWSASSGGSCGFTGTVTDGAVEDGGNATVEVGNLTVTQPVAS
ncbi:MAG: hypothetical protein U5R31_03000 [Acidimicrobiia bacterium]|nr:hypothetical protein [Acidimicrobiia bacterium]